MGKWSNLAACLSFLVFILISGPTAYGYPIVQPTVVNQGNGVYTYSYELGNPIVSGESVFDFGLFFSGMPANVIAPNGWSAIYGLGFIDWMSQDFLTDLLPGNSLNGFSFESDLGPGSITFISLGADILTGDVGTPYFGDTVGPVSVVPEPASIVLISIGLFALFVSCGKRNIFGGALTCPVNTPGTFRDPFNSYS